MPLAGKGLTLGARKGLSMFPGCILTEGGVVLTWGNDRSLFIHCLNSDQSFLPLTGPGTVRLHTQLPVLAL